MLGRTFGRLTVIGFAGNHGKRLVKHWFCKCKCGKSLTVSGNNLRSGNTKSCGCYCKEVVTFHGLSGSTFGRTWAMMTQRCYNEKARHFSYYGGRGIKICEFIRKSPANLLSVVGQKPLGHTLDRKDNNGNYSCGRCDECVANGWPLNIQWATRKEQARNTRFNRRFTVNGETHCVSEWAEIIGISTGAIFKRLRNGYTGQDLIAKSLKPNPL